MEHDFFRPAPGTVHAAHPFHLLSRFQLFGHAFAPCHLADKQFHSLHTGFIDLNQMLKQLPGQKQIRVQYRTVLFQIAHTHPAVFSDRLLSIFSNGKVRKEYIADLCISAAVLCIKGFLRFQGLYLQNHIGKYRKRESLLFVSLTKRIPSSQSPHACRSLTARVCLQSERVPGSSPGPDRRIRRRCFSPPGAACDT